MGGLKALSPADVRILKTLVQDYRSRRLRAFGDDSQGDDIQSADVYVAKPQSAGGIPPREADEPGEAECDVYKVIPFNAVDNPTGPNIVEATGVTRTVYNLSTSTISQTYISIEKTKYGKWVTDGQGSDEVTSPGTSTPFLYRWFELKGMLPSAGSVTPGTEQSAQAHPRDWAGGNWVTDTAGGRVFTVWDAEGGYRGRGRDSGYSSPHEKGSMGIAIFNDDSGRWEIWYLQPNALMIRGTADSAYADDENPSLGSAVVMQPTGSIITHSDPAGSITINNFFGDTGEAASNMIAIWDEAAAAWKLMRGASTGPAVMLKGIVDQSDFGPTTATFNVRGITTMFPKGAPIPSATMTDVNNILKHPGYQDDTVLLFFDQQANDWDGILEQNLSYQDNVTDIDYDPAGTGTAHNFCMKKTRNTLVWQADDQDSTWYAESGQVWHATTEETLTVNLETYSAGTALEYNTEKFHMLEAGDTPATSTWATITQVTYLTDVDYEGSAANTFEKKTRTGYVFNPGSESAWLAWAATVAESSIVTEVHMASGTLHYHYKALRVMESAAGGTTTIADTTSCP